MSETSKEENNKEHESSDPINEERVNASENKQKKNIWSNVKIKKNKHGS